MEKFNLEQKVKEYAKVPNNSRSTVDLLFTNVENTYIEVTSEIQ